jgi:hypothetical protein
MASEPDPGLLEELTEPDLGLLKELIEWRPPHGVISAYLDTEPTDRKEGWRLALRDGLKPVGEAKGASHAAKIAIRATVERVQEHFPEGMPRSGRCQIGFVEVAEKPGRDLWSATQIVPAMPAVVHRERPYLEPLVELLDDGWPVGAVAVSAEQIRLFEWRLGITEELDRWGARISRRAWRERKAAKPRNPAAGQAVSAAGKDQYDQRLEANRERFLRRTGPLIAEEADRRDWRLVLAYGDPHEVEILGADADGLRLEAAGDANVVNETVEEVGRRVTVAVTDLNRNRELELVERATDAALENNRRGSLGLAPTFAALAEGRVEHLIFQGASRVREERTEAVAKSAEDLIEGAVRTSAQITPVEGEAAEALTPHEGVAALWRY